jgi:peptidoglycan/xylan/chitin deacetylase (PgdA/CDA1 family)
MLGPLKERAFAVMHHTGLSARVASSGWRRRRLLILGYHGIARWDEDLWNPGLYFSASRFARRLELLRRHRCNVLPLGEAIDRLGRNDLPDRAVVLTFDDGYHDFATIAYPLLRAHGYPATVYLTTLRCEHNFPIVRLLLSYLLWSKREAQLDGSGLPGLVPKRYPLADAKTREAVVDALTAAARESHFDRFDNDEVARQVAGRLGLAYDRYSAMHLLTLLSPEDVAQLANEGVDFQMHSHRHWSPEDPALLARDLRNNRERIERLTGGRAFLLSEWRLLHQTTGDAQSIRHPNRDNVRPWPCKCGYRSAAAPSLRRHQPGHREHIFVVAEWDGGTDVAAHRRREIAKSVSWWIRDSGIPTIRVPGSEPREHSGHVLAVSPVLVAETGAEHRLLQQRDVKQIDDQKQERPLNVRRGSEQRRFAEQNENHSTDHRIADTAVGALDDEPPGGIPGRQRALSVGGKPAE